MLSAAWEATQLPLHSRAGGVESTPSRRTYRPSNVPDTTRNYMACTIRSRSSMETASRSWGLMKMPRRRLWRASKSSFSNLVCFLQARHGEVCLKPRCVASIADLSSGPKYNSAEVFDLTTMEPYTLDKLNGQLGSATSTLALYLPRTSDLRQLARMVKSGEKAAVIHYCTDGGSRALCAYLGSGWKAPA